VDVTLATSRIRNHVTLVSNVICANPPEELVTTVGEQIQLMVDENRAGDATQVATVRSMLGSSYRVTIRATVTRTLRCAEAPQRQHGTIETTSERGGTTTDRGQSSGSSTFGLEGEAEGGGRTGGASASTTTGRERERTTARTRTDTTRTSRTGAYDENQEQWDYRVQWTVNADIDSESWNPLNLVAELGGSGHFGERGAVDIGTQTHLNTDPTPARRGGGRRAPTPEPVHRPERIVGHGG
jgi:hypothetical protein